MSSPNTHAEALVISSDERLLDHAHSAAASARMNVVVSLEAATIRAAWRTAALVLIGVESGALVAGLGLPERHGVHLIGREAAPLLGWSVPLGASALVLPDQSGVLAQLMGDGVARLGERATLITVLGGSGGVGASTLAAALAQRGCARGLDSALVEHDPDGAGIDLLFGAESAPGWRWPDLVSARGHIGDLHGQLPNVSGVDLVSCGRAVGQLSSPVPRRATGEAVAHPALTPGFEAVRAVLDSLMASHDLVVVDHAAADDVSATIGTALVVAAADARGALAARARIRRLGLQTAGLVVRTGPGRRLHPDHVAETVGLRLIGVIGQLRALPLAQEVGDPPGRARGRFARQVDRVLSAVLDDD